MTAVDSSDEADQFVSSRYNFSVAVEGGSLLFNANSGAVLNLQGRQGAELCSLLCSAVTEFDVSWFPAQLWDQLIGGSFLVPSGTNEVEGIRRRFLEARAGTPLVLTLTTTMDCNLGCFYCYEQRTPDELTKADLSAIVESARERLRQHQKKSLHVDWYGGEPLLNMAFIELASPALQAMCQAEGAAYHASIISNGTVWPGDPADFIRRHCIRQVQVSFDGMPDHHNRRRRYRKGQAAGNEGGSFEVIANLVDSLLECVRVDLRFNTDFYNQTDLPHFVEFAKKKGWFERKFPAVIQPARLAAYTEHASFLREKELPPDRYDALRDVVREIAGKEIRVDESEAPDGFPYPKTSVCAALANHSEVFGADGLTYRCGLQVGEQHRAVGSIRPEKAHRKFPDYSWWEAFDPTLLPNCSRCSFLPICWGGCPKKHLENDQHALEEQSRYWRTNLPRLITTRFGLKPEPGFSYTESDQFR